MVNRLEILLSHNFREIVGSPLVLELMDIYSKLFLNGSQVGYCEKCLSTYYNQLIKNGKEMAQLYEQVKKRTCKPAWNGLRYIPRQARHFNSDLMTDEQATELLIDGVFKESDFEVLPEIYIEMKSDKKTDQQKESIPDKPKKPKQKRKE